MGPSFLIIKKGTDGALLYGDSQVFECPAYFVDKCIDPTGAGDTFAGAFIGHLSDSDDTSFQNMTTAVIKACAMASFCVEDFGVKNIINTNNLPLEERIQALNKRCFM